MMTPERYRMYSRRGGGTGRRTQDVHDTPAGSRADNDDYSPPKLPLSAAQLTT